MSTKEQDSALANGKAASEPGQENLEQISTGPSWVQLALVVVLVTALAIAAITVLTQLVPSGPWRLMPLFALLVAIESVITRRWLEWPERKRQLWAYTVAELIVLLTLAPLFLWLSAGQVPAPSSIIDLLENPFIAFNIPLACYMILAFLVWERAHSWSTLFVSLTITQDEFRYYWSSPTQRADDRSIVAPIKHRTAILKQFVNGWIVGGALLIFLVALASFDMRAAASLIADSESLRTVTRLGLDRGLLIALLAYFLGGLWLISQGRATVLKAKWLSNRSRPDPRVVNRWRGWTLLFLAGLSFMALFLPIGTTYPLLRVIQAIFQALLTVISAIISLIFLIIRYIVMLLPDVEPPEGPPPDLAELLGQQQPTVVEPTSTAPALFFGSLFWLTLIGLTVAATLYFMRDRGPNFSLAFLGELWHHLKHWLFALGRNAANTAKAALAQPIRLRLRRPTIGDRVRTPFRFLRIGALPPREQVRFLYLSLLRHAEKQGLPRPHSKTPIEFAQDLKVSWPEAVDDLDQLTSAFLIARYGVGEIDSRRLQLVKDAWLRIRRSGGQRGRNQEGQE
ncbi:MAG: DUF4129 domain-containing protein [Chloroflexota bacterium]